MDTPGRYKQTMCTMERPQTGHSSLWRWCYNTSTGHGAGSVAPSMASCTASRTDSQRPSGNDARNPPSTPATRAHAACRCSAASRRPSSDTISFCLEKIKRTSTKQLRVFATLNTPAEGIVACLQCFMVLLQCLQLQFPAFEHVAGLCQLFGGAPQGCTIPRCTMCHPL